MPSESKATAFLGQVWKSTVVQPECRVSVTPEKEFCGISWNLFSYLMNEFDICNGFINIFLCDLWLYFFC